MVETITLKRMCYGPQAVGQLQSGKTVFVEGGAPQDIVSIEIFEEKQRFARARIVSLVQASPLRVAPTSKPVVSDASCPWAHLTYEAQLYAKRFSLIDALVHIACFEPSKAQEVITCCDPSTLVWGYRNKLELSSCFSKGCFVVGDYSETTPALVERTQSPLACKPLTHAPKSLQGALRFAQGSQEAGIFRIGVRASLRTKDLEIALWTSPGPFPRAHVSATLQSALKPTSIVRVLAKPGKQRVIKGVETLWGKGCWEEELAGFRFLTSAPSFFQVNTAQAEHLVDVVCTGLATSLSHVKNTGGSGKHDKKLLSGAVIADLYAGGGTFSLPLARQGAHVIAVESAGSSVRDLRRNVLRAGVDVEVIGGDAARELNGLDGLDAVVLDPPRSGLTCEAMQAISQTTPSQICYVSCNPATWARDVARLQKKGYHLVGAHPVDLFPQTYHVEIVSFFSHTL